MKPLRWTPSDFDDDIYIRNGIYWFRGNPAEGKPRIERSLKIREPATQKSVIRAKNELLEAEQNRGYVKGRTDFMYIAKKYIEERTLEFNENLLSEKTLAESKKVMLDHFRFFERTKVEEISQPLFTEYCKAKRNITVHTHRKVMSHFLKWCVQSGHLKMRPEIQIPKFAKKPVRQREILSEDEVKLLFKHLRPDATLYHAMYLLMGMRNSEILKLKWENVNLETGALRVHKSTNKSKKPRVLPINAWVLALLKAQPRKNEYVFPTRTPGGKKGHRDTTAAFRKPWAKALKDAGIVRHLTPQDMRATFEYWMHKNTAFTDTQREKMAGANIDVQKNIYVTMDVGALRGLENSVQIEGLDQIMHEKIPSKNGANVGAKSKKRGLAND
jgi:integrase